MKRTLLLLLLATTAIGYIVTLRKQLESARLRGDMYRDISARLDRRVAELTAQQ